MKLTPFRPASQRGMTLTELLVASTVLSLFGLMLWSTAEFQTRLHRRETSQNLTQGTLRLWTDRLVRDVRNSGHRPRPDSPEVGILEAGPSSIRFTLDAVPPWGVHDPADARENVGYRITDVDADGFGRLERWLGGDRWRSLLAPVRLRIRYFDNQGAEIGGIGAPPAVGSIRRVDVTLTARAEGSGETSATSSAWLRNAPADAPAS